MVETERERERERGTEREIGRNRERNREMNREIERQAERGIMLRSSHLVIISTNVLYFTEIGAPKVSGKARPSQRMFSPEEAV